MVVCVETSDGVERFLNIQDIKVEDNKISIRLKPNSDNIVLCEYSGNCIDEYVDAIKSGEMLQVDGFWQVYREFKALVRYEDYSLLEEYNKINNIVSASNINVGGTVGKDI